MKSTPRDSLIHEIAETLKADASDRFDGATIRKGFPRNLDFELPGISIAFPQEERVKSRQRVRRVEEIDATTVAVYFERERCELSGTIELWTATKLQREALELALDHVLSGDELAAGGFEDPPPPGLSLTLSLLYDATTRVLLIDKAEQDAGGSASGYFRIIYSVTASVPDLVRVEYNKADWTNTVSTVPDLADL